MNENIYCPAEKAVLLASYATQVKFGDFDSDIYTPGYLANEKLLSKIVIDQHKLSMEEWETKISAFHQQHRGTSRDEAMLEYLKIAQELNDCNTRYLRILNIKNG